MAKTPIVTNLFVLWARLTVENQHLSNPTVAIARAVDQKDIVFCY